MREIKFRAYSKEMKEMRYLDCERDANYGHIICGNGELFKDVMQFTGLEDKNGKEIYEGDILKTWDGKTGYVAFGRVLDSSAIAYSGFYIRFNQEEYDNLDGSLEIIGNVFENPELLEGWKCTN